MPSPAEQLGERVLKSCDDLGFALAGITGAESSRHEAELRAWLDAGRHGSMAYLARQVEERLSPQRLMPGARSMVLVADQYAARGTSEDPPLPLWHGKVARYARGRDYHEIIKRRLHALCDRLRAEHPGETFRAFVDTAPVLEREHAARAGLGWVGKHTLLIHPRVGSYLLLGGVLTTLELRQPGGQMPITDHCGTCTRCIDACPTRAISPYSVDATRCIAYLTIERRGPIDPRLHEPMGQWVFGCDVCQEVCPHNSPRDGGVEVGRPGPAYAGGAPSLDLLAVLGWSPEDRAAALRGSAMKRATLEMWKRNAIIALGNAISDRADPTPALERLRRASQDHAETELVRRTAREVLDRLERARSSPPASPAAPPRPPH